MSDVYSAILAGSAALTSLTGVVGMVLQNKRMSRIERERAAEQAAHLYGEHDQAVEWAHTAHHLETSHQAEAAHHPDSGTTDGSTP